MTAILDAAGGDTAIENSLLEADDEESLQTQILGLTPEYSGGNFDLATSSSRLAAAHLYDHETMFSVSDTRIWVESYYLNGDYDPDSIAGGYSLGSFGLTGGYEAGTPFGRVGLSANISWGSNSNGTVDAEVDASHYEAALHWREQLGGLLMFARGSFAYVGYSSERTFEGDLDGTADDDEDDDEAGFLRVASGDFDGLLYSGLVGASYQAKLGQRFTLTPLVSLEYFRLDEDGYEETGGGDGMNLIVEDRSSDSLSINSTLALAYAIGPQQPDMIPMSIEIEAGRRTVLNGSLGDTIAEFEDVGDSFRLMAPDIESAWLGEISIIGGGYDFLWSVNAAAEHEGDRTVYSLRAGLGIAF
ncbi:autotransporter outer membrane beta-barrel domain-containing protein [Erythrobacter sp. YT30]|uniref:autotransporter outer membrane beta-barrel domain-containing protein n=1 Tax=Erythrobacter sp. YT30 TaxID=1735012 RepID=UPI00076CB4CC|nr:autotransporter outer membrane beta-barrel domain-containing protein [Erythrobacter sp. YT30]KWV91073.1 hypothetical protein AUC45_07080 [Erythrobacter sp. YT30]